MRRNFNKILQLFALFNSINVTNKIQFKDVQLKRGKSGSLSAFAEGINPNTLSMKRVKGKWRVKK